MTLTIDGARVDIEALGGRELERRRQRDPELIAADRRAVDGGAAVPDAAAGAHPLDAPLLQNPRLAGRVRVADPAAEQRRVRRDAGVRMRRDPTGGPPVALEIVEEHEGLEDLAEVARADQPGDEALPVTGRAVDDAACGGGAADHRLKRAHGVSPLARQRTSASPSCRRPQATTPVRARRARGAVGALWRDEQMGHDGADHHGRQEDRAEEPRPRHEQRDRAAELEDASQVAEPLPEADGLEQLDHVRIAGGDLRPRAAAKASARRPWSDQSAMLCDLAHGGAVVGEALRWSWLCPSRRRAESSAVEFEGAGESLVLADPLLGAARCR